MINRNRYTSAPGVFCLALFDFLNHVHALVMYLFDKRVFEYLLDGNLTAVVTLKKLKMMDKEIQS